MSSEIQVAKFLKCSRCAGPVSRQNGSDPFFTCQGSDNAPHVIFMISSKFDTKNGKLEEGVKIDWEEIDRAKFGK